MSFQGTELQRRKSFEGGKEFKKLEFLRLQPGNYQVRILQTPYVPKYTHWVNTKTGPVTIECLGDELCPICINNQKIMLEHPEDYRSIPGFLPYSVTCFVNVLDKSLVKVCPKCGAENYRNSNGDFMPACRECNESLVAVEPQPSNRVKILSRSRAMFKQLEEIDNTIKQTSGQSITEYDLALVVRPRESGLKGSNVTVIPQPQLIVPVPDGLELFDLERAVVRLEPNEIRELINGIALRDIFAARKPDVSDISAQSATESLDSVQELADKTQQAVMDALSAYQGKG